MALTAQSMLHRALEAFVQRDLALAQAVLIQNGEVDTQYNQIYRDLLAFIRDNSQTKGDSRVLVNHARYLARIARNLKRAAGQVTHICEWVAFAVTGEMAHVKQEPIRISPKHAAHHPEVQCSAQETVLHYEGDPR
jgi:phosphate transport system protein